MLEEDDDPSSRGLKWGILIYVLGIIYTGLFLWGKLGNTPEIAKWVANVPLALSVTVMIILLYGGSWICDGIPRIFKRSRKLSR